MSTTKGNHTVLVSVTAGAAAGATETLCTVSQHLETDQEVQALHSHY